MGRSGRSIAFVLPLLISSWSAAAHAQTVRGRTVSEPNRTPVGDVAITAVDTSGQIVGQTTTGDDGFFRLDGIGGRVMLRAARFGFLPDSQSVDVAASGDTSIPAFVLVADAVVLDTIKATADRAIASGGRRTRVISGARMAWFAEHGMDVASVARELASLRVRPDGWSYCVESTRRTISFRDGRNGPPPCNMVAVIFNGFEQSEPAHILRSLPLTSIESIEYVDPMSAGFRYGFRASTAGALVIWMRGRGPHASSARGR